MEYTRIYSDENGESHFEDIEVEFTVTDFAPPAPPLGLSSFSASKRFGYMTAPPGWYGDWHPAPAKQICIYISGFVEAQVSDGEVRTFGPGSVTLLEDTSGTGHRSRIVGEEDAILAVVQLE